MYSVYLPIGAIIQTNFNIFFKLLVDYLIDRIYQIQQHADSSY